MTFQGDVIYKSLSQVLRALIYNKEYSEVKSIINLCVSTGVIRQNKINELRDNSGKPAGQETMIALDSEGSLGNIANGNSRKAQCRHPFIVIEGLDGTGKTTLTRFLSERLHMKLMSTPPKNYDTFIGARDYFDAQGESIRRAYYSLGNYLVANEILKCEQPVVMDRFWHSTAAYALAHLKKSGKSFEASTLTWPVDLLQPDLVIFLEVSEKERLRRHSSRKDFTNTKEEQTLADDAIFRQNLVQYYRSVIGPPMQELMINGEQRESEAIILKAVLKHFPDLERRTIECKSS